MSESDNPPTQEQSRYFVDVCREYAPDFYSYIERGVIKDGLRPSVDVPGDVSYLVDTNVENKRTRTSLTRYLVRRQGCHINFNGETELADVSSAMRTHLLGREAINDEFKILCGEEIPVAYATQKGGKSCMTGVYGLTSEHKNIAEIQKWYSMWGDALRLLVWNERKGRALYWRDDDGRLWVDRVYGCGPLGYCRFQEWATLHKARMIYESGEKAKVTLGQTAFNIPMPYMDSFKYVNAEGVFFTQPSMMKYSYLLTITDGNWERARVLECRDCGKIVSPRDGHRSHVTSDGHTICGRCRDNYFQCPCCTDLVMRNENPLAAGRNCFCNRCYNEATFACTICNTRYWEKPKDKTMGEMAIEMIRALPTNGIPTEQAPPLDHTHPPAPAEPICPSCIRREFDFCSGCSKNTRKRDLTAYQNDLCGGLYCTTCLPKIKRHILPPLETEEGMAGAISYYEMAEEVARRL